MAAQQTPNQWGRMFTPDALSEYGGLGAPVPQGPFDPAGAWTQTWRIWLLKRSGNDVNHRGFIKLKREPSPDRETFDLRATQATIQMSQGCVHEMKARIRCANNALATPFSWSLTTRLFSARDGHEFSQAAVDKRGAIKRGKITTDRGGRIARRDAPGAVTSSWSILDALQRLPGPGTTPLEFAFLDELDKCKPNHRLTHREETTIPFGGEAVQVQCYQQIGEGLLPWMYYVDMGHRLLLAMSGLRAYILDPAAEQDHEKLLRRIGGGGRRP